MLMLSICLKVCVQYSMADSFLQSGEKFLLTFVV